MPGAKKNQSGCLIEDCDREYYAKGYCSKHYGNLSRCGDPLGTRYKKEPLADCVCGKPMMCRSRGLCKACYSTWYYTERAGVAGERLGRRKAEVTYNAAHHRVYMARGRASSHDCVSCLNPAQQWALSHEATDLRYGESAAGRGDKSAYSLNPYSYLAMCRKCHDTYDAEARGHTYKKATV